MDSNQTSTKLLTAAEMERFQSPLFLGATAIMTGVITFLMYLSQKPSVHYKSPRFTKDVLPILGSMGFILRPWGFWQACSEEAKKATGNFSFWVGKKHLVGITSSASRKMFYEHPTLDLVSGGALLPFGVHFWPPVHEVFRAGYARGINNTYFLRRLVDFQSTKHLAMNLPRLRDDARKGLEDLMVDNPRAVMSPPSIWPVILNQNNRVLVSDQVVDDPKLGPRVLNAGDILTHCYSPFNVHLPWLPSPSWMKRRYARWTLQRTISGLINQRTKPGGPQYQDALQSMIDNGDRHDWIVEYCTSIIFIGSANAGVIGAQMLNIMAMYPEWQERIFQEIKATVEAHSKDQTSSLVDRLSALPLEVWESGFPSLYLCLQECMRMWGSFNAARLNTSTDPIYIPGTDEVIPGNTYVIYNTTQCNYNEDLYPSPFKFDPERHMEGREEFKKEQYGYVGWGQGKHPCAGKRWAKLQQAILVAYALALYKWKRCDENGKPDITSQHYKDLDSREPFNLPPAYCKLEPRENF